MKSLTEQRHVTSDRILRLRDNILISENTQNLGVYISVKTAAGFTMRPSIAGTANVNWESRGI